MHIYAHIHTYGCCFYPIGRDPKKSTQRRRAPGSSQLTLGEMCSYTSLRSHQCKRRVWKCKSWLQQGDLHHQPGQRETESHTGAHRLSPARKGGARQELQLKELPKDHRPIDLFLTVSALGQVPPGVSPAPQSAQSWG